jgi:hypothetical protein
MKTGIKVVKNFVFGAFLLATLSILPIQGIKADVVEGLYEAELPVEGQSREEQSAVIREALKSVLARISGRDSASALAADESLIPNPSRLVEQFRYRKFKTDEVIPEPADGAKPYTQMLWMRFTENALSDILVKQGLPIWGKSRPATLVWLVVDDQKQRVLIGNNTPHISRSYIEEEAKKRGLPIRLPLLDLADQSRLQITDVWGNFEDTILSASQRYQTEAILVGRIYLSFANTWNTRWTLYLEGQRQDWEIANNVNLHDAVIQGISKTGEDLSVKFAQVKDATETNTVMVQIKNITDLKTYNLTINYLQGLNIVSQINPYKVSKGSVIFEINSHSGRLGLAQAIALGHVLISDVNDPVVQTENKEKDSQQLQAALVYKLVP